MDTNIPKIIHYCWFGEKDLTPLAKRCIKSWETNLPEYEIKCWNEENFDLNINRFVREAYDEGKFAFVTDYVRLFALYNEGGIYMDTDVEVLKPLDSFLHFNAFSGFQTPSEIPTGIIGAKPRNQWIEKNLIFYKGIGFINKDGSYNNTANVAHITKISKQMGLVINGQKQVFSDNIAIYPIDYFCAKNYKTGEVSITENTFTVHHFAGSWLSRKEKIKLVFTKKIRYIMSKISKT